MEIRKYISAAIVISVICLCGCSKSQHPQNPANVIEAYKTAQQGSDFTVKPYAGYLVAIEQVDSVEELMVIFPKSIQSLPVDVFKNASGLKEINREHIKEYRSKRIILKVDLPKEISEHSIAAVHYKKDQNDKPRCDLYLYEDEVWKEYVAIQDPSNIEKECREMGIVIENNKLIDDSAFIQSLITVY